MKITFDVRAAAPFEVPERALLIHLETGDVFALTLSADSLAMTLSDGEVQPRPQLRRHRDAAEARRHFDFMCASARRLRLKLFHVGPPWRG